MWRFFYPSGFAVRWAIQALQEKAIIVLTPSRGNASGLNIFRKVSFAVTQATGFDYDVSSLSAISQMGTGPGKGVFTAVKQALQELVSAGLSPVVNGGAVSLQGPHNETLSVYRVHCRQRFCGKK